MQATRDFSHYVRDRRRRPAAHRSRGRRRQLRRLHGEDRARTVGDPRRHAGARQPDRPPRRAGMEAGHARSRPASSIGSPSSATRPIRSRPRARRRPRPRSRASCCAASASRRLPTMNVMMLSIPVWSGNVSDMMPEQRDFFHWLSALIALPAAAYAGQPFFRSAWRALRTRQHQHGRADLDRRHASRSACRWSRPSIMPSTPISTRRSCC